MEPDSREQHACCGTEPVTRDHDPEAGPPLRICMFSNLLAPPAFTGSATFTWELARRLAARGHHVAVVTARLDTAPAQETREGVAIHRLRAVRLPRMALAHNFPWMTYTWLPGNMRRLRALFRAEGFHVVHQQNHIFDTILASRSLAERFRLPLVLTIHTFVQHPRPLYDRVLAALDAVARRVILRRADAVVSPDPVCQEYLRARHGITDSPQIPYGIEVRAPTEDQVRQVRERFALGEGPVILSLGHVHKLRPRLDLIGAMPAVLARFPSARLLIVGEVQAQEPVELARALGLGERVTFAGALPHDLVPALFAVSALEAHTFEGPYPGPGIASMEAMAAGLPVISGEISPRYDFGHLRNWENIVFVPPGRAEAMAEALLRLLGNEALRRTIGQNARKMMAQRYSWDAVCSAYLSLYRRLVRSRAALEGLGR